MTVARIDQVIPTLASRDAIGGHVVQLRDLLRSRGYQSDIYYGNATADRLDDGLPVGRLGDRSSTRRVLLYQLSIGSGVADVFRERAERKFVNYHNITPADLLDAWVPAVGEEVRRGRAQLRDLAPITEFAIADSAFNERELQVAGYRSTTTVPLLIDLDGFAGSPDPALAARLADQKASGGADLLFVGKVSPHKGQHDLVKALAAYRRLYDPNGPAASGRRGHQRRLPDGHRAVRQRAGPARRRGHRRVGDPRGTDRLLRRAADAFVCLSNHEGFCVPLLEAMYHRLPIVAYTNTAVPETVRGGRADPAQQGAGPGGRGHRPGGPRSRAPLDAGRGGLGAGGDLRPAPGAGRVRVRPRGSLRGVTPATGRRRRAR